MKSLKEIILIGTFSFAPLYSNPGPIISYFLPNYDPIISVKDFVDKEWSQDKGKEETRKIVKHKDAKALRIKDNDTFFLIWSGLQKSEYKDILF